MYFKETVGTCEVAINPLETQPPTKAHTVSIANESFFGQSNGHIAKTCMLLLRVHHVSVNPVTQNGEVDGNIHFFVTSN